MPPQPIPFIGGSYPSRSSNFDCQRSINLYPEASSSGQSKGVAMLVGCPGITPWAQVVDSPLRGMCRFSAKYSVVVAGGSVYLMTTAGVSTKIGTIAARTTPVSMASNGTAIMLVTGQEAYFITPNLTTPASSTVVIAPGVVANTVYFADGYFIFNSVGTQQFRLSGLFATTLDPLDYASKEGAADLLQVVIVNQLEVVLLGERTSEVWTNTGNANFPYQRIPGSFMEVGCVAIYSAARTTNTVFWLSSDERGDAIAVSLSGGYQPQPISTPAQQEIWRGYSTVADAVGFTYQQAGHTFYVLTFPTANATWVYDTLTQLWHERVWRDPVLGTFNRHRANCVMNFAGQILVGDWQTGTIYSLSLDVYTDSGSTMPAIRQFPHFATADNTNLIFDRLWIDMETGVGLNSGQGINPKLMIQWSDDGGHTWSNEHWVNVGAMGQYRARAFLNRCGRSRDRVWRVMLTDPVKRVFLGAGATTRPCRS